MGQSAWKHIWLQWRAYCVDRLVCKRKLRQTGFLATKLGDLDRVCDHQDILRAETPSIHRAVLFAPAREDLQACQADLSLCWHVQFTLDLRGM